MKRVDLNIKDLKEIKRHFMKYGSDKDFSSKYRDLMFTFASTIQTTIELLESYKIQEEKYTECIGELREANKNLLLGDYYNKLQEQQNNLISTIIGYLEDLRY